jgi:hypothetical protein
MKRQDNNLYSYVPKNYVRCVAVTTVLRVLRLQMEEWPPAMEGSCEYTG